MNRRGSGPIIVLFAVLAVLVAAGGIWMYSKTRHAAPSAGQPPQNTVAQAGTTSTTTPQEQHLGIIYKGFDYSNYYAPQNIYLYDISSGTSSTIRDENGITDAASRIFADWTDYQNNTIFFSDYSDVNSNSLEVDLFSSTTLNASPTYLKRSSIVDDSSVVVSRDGKRIGYCGPDGQYTVRNLLSGSSTDYTGTNICQVAYQGDVMFSPDASAIYYQDVSANGAPETDTGSIQVQYKKLTLSTGAITTVGDLVTSPYFNDERTEFAELRSNGITVYTVSTPEKLGFSTLDTLPIVINMPLPDPTSAGIQTAMFTKDGKGIVYVTRSMNDTYAMHYFDFATRKTSGVPIPDINIWAFQLFGAADAHSIVYGAWEEKSYGDATTTLRQSNVMDLYSGSTDAPARLIDKAGEFQIFSFVRSK